MNAATEQRVGGLWHSHAVATDQPRDWRGVLTLDGTRQERPSYYLNKQDDPYGCGEPRPLVSGRVNGCTRTLAPQVALRNRMW